MGPALDTVLARPSALRLLRWLTTDLDSPRSPLLSRSARCLRGPLRAAHPRRHTTLASDDSTVCPGPGQSTPSVPCSRRTPVSRKDGTCLALLVSLYAGAPLAGQTQDGRTAFEALVYEADVANPPHSRLRLVDDEKHTHNMDLWLELLRFRKRLDGPRGVTEVWMGMRQRNVCLPVQGPVSDALWSVFLSVGFADHQDLLEELYIHAKYLRDVLGLQRPALYQHFVGGWLRATPRRAAKWHQRLSEDRFLPRNPAASIVEHVNHSSDRKEAWNAFKKIYKTSQASGVYDLCMPSICEHCDVDVALKWHRFLVAHNDFPSSALRSNTVISRLFDYARSRRFVSTDATSTTGKDYTASQGSRVPENEVPLFSRQHMSTLVGDVHGIRQRKVGDAFCARLFATNAFSVDLVISGLRLLGLETIGSLALREIAARAQTLSEYISAVRAIETAGIVVEQTTFSRALRKFAEHGEQENFQMLVQSDRHPDTYDNGQLQQQLFTSFVAAGKMSEAHATLAVLSIDHPDPNQLSWNLLLKTHARRNDRRRVLQALHEMRLLSVPVSDKSLSHVFYGCLRQRAPSKRPTVQGRIEHQTHQSDLDFVTNVFLDVLKSGQYVRPARWRELLRRYGMTNRLQSLERLSFWLGTYYSRHVKIEEMSCISILQQPRAMSPENQYLPTHLKTSHPSHPFSEIFSIALLRAIVAWGFKSAARPIQRGSKLEAPSIIPHGHASHSTSYEWARGIELIRDLRDRYGLHVNSAVLKELRREVVIRLWMLYGPGRSDSKLNRVARRVNRLPLCQYVRHIERVWDDEKRPFFNVPRELLERGSVAEANLYFAIFKRTKRPRKDVKDAGAHVPSGRLSGLHDDLYDAPLDLILGPDCTVASTDYAEPGEDFITEETRPRSDKQPPSHS
ncbi:hypothetical protein MBLNU459_g2156t1 [Dothideomycetes sp. NU459]